MILEHITNKLIPSFMDALRYAQVMSPVDLESLLFSYCLNFSHLPLIYEKAIQTNEKKIRRLLVS